MGRAVSLAIPPIDEAQRQRERQETLRLLRDAWDAEQRAYAVAAKLRRMTDLYRERLDGVREK